MTPEDQTSHTAELFDQALARPPDQRSAFLKEACAGDDELFHKVSRLLENAGVRTGDVLPDPGSVRTPPLPDSIMQRYESIEFLGRGGMGVVYRARDRELGELVALKMLDPAYARNEQMIERFRNEIRLGREIAHKNVCRTYGLERFDGTIFIEMEYVDGQTLRTTLDRIKGVSVPQGLNWAEEICDALAAAHNKNVIHRDLKPENIMIDREGHIKVMDFGIARSIDSSELTSGTNIGTPGYMSPEQVMGGAVGPSTDIYSLGVVLYELFTGSRRSQSAIPPGKVNPYLPGQIDRTIRKCLEENPKDRFQSADEVSINLAGVPALDQGGKWIKKIRAAALVTLLTAFLVGIFFVTQKPPKPQHDGPVNALAFSSDGRVLASASEDKTIKLWDALRMRNLHTLADHIRAVSCVAFSSNGRWLASGSADKTIKVWEVGTGRLTHTFKDKKTLAAVALSPNGLWLASTSDQTVKLWEVQTARLAHVLRHDDSVNALAFSADGGLLASASDDETVRVWEVSTGHPVTGPLRHDDEVDAVAFSPDGRLLASGGMDKSIKLWSATTWIAIQTLRQEGPVWVLAFNLDGSLLMSASEDGRVMLWGAPTWRELANLMASERGTALTWAFSHDGRNLAVGTREGAIKLQPLRTLNANK